MEESGIRSKISNKGSNRILVIGYYNKDNLGDDAYQGVMGNFFPDHELKFIGSKKLSTIDGSEYDAIIVGGGDIINDYFNDDIGPFLRRFKGPKIAFSIGIPFPSLINDKYLGHFDHVFTRNYEDIRSLQKLLGSHRAHFIPDIALAYKANHAHKSILSDASTMESSVSIREVKRIPPPNKRANKKCGVFLVGNIMEFPKIVEDISHLISKISLTYNVILYCFNPAEDNKIANETRRSALKRLYESYTDDSSLKALLEVAKQEESIKVDTRKYTAQEMIDIMTELDFAVCMRYHSHIFCTVAGTPFMSISSTRKTRSFMKQAGLSRYQYKIPLDGYCTPIGSDYVDMRNICRDAIHDKVLISRQLQAFLSQSRFLLSSKQAYRLITNNKMDIRQGVADFITETNDHQNGARLLSNYVIGYPDSPYVWGMYEKFKDAGDVIADVIHESAQYLLRHGATMTNEFLNLLSINHSEKRIPLYTDIREYQTYKGAHRGGWYIACEELYKLNDKNQHGLPNGIICDMYVDRTFHWANSYMSYQGIIPYTSPWCGFVHHTFDTFYSQYNSSNLFDIPEFVQSLHTCLAIFVLSEPLAENFRTKLAVAAPHIKVVTFTHPVVHPLIPFTTNNFNRNKNPKLINIGAWLRNPFTIYRLSNIPIQKSILIGKEMGDHLPPDNFKIAHLIQSISKSPTSKEILPTLPCRPSVSVPRWVLMAEEWLRSLGINPSYYEDGVIYIKEENRVEEINNKMKEMIRQVEVINYKSNDDYDLLLKDNIVFLDLIDAAAVNTIIECIVRRTPIIVNKIPGTIALLGDRYPLFYNNPSEVSKLLQKGKIELAYKYLNKLDTKKYKIESFIKQIRTVAEKLVPDYMQ